jgi:hypothetical protein
MVNKTIKYHALHTLDKTTILDTPPHSLNDSNANPKVETSEEEVIGVHSLIQSTLGLKGRAKAPRWGLG